MAVDEACAAIGRFTDAGVDGLFRSRAAHGVAGERDAMSVPSRPRQAPAARGAVGPSETPPSAAPLPRRPSGRRTCGHPDPRACVGTSAVAPTPTCGPSGRYRDQRCPRCVRARRERGSHRSRDAAPTAEPLFGVASRRRYLLTPTVGDASRGRGAGSLPWRVPVAAAGLHASWAQGGAASDASVSRREET